MKHRPNVIKDRLYKRDSKNYSIDLLEKLQNSEIERAVDYSKRNNIRLFIYDESEPFHELVRFIQNEGE